MEQNIIIDLHNGGPIIYNDELLKSAFIKYQKNMPINQLIREINKERVSSLIAGTYPEYKNAWITSGVNLAIRTVGIFTDPPFSSRGVVEDVALVNKIIKHVEWLELVTDKDSFHQIMIEGKKGYLLMIESLEGFRPDENWLEVLQKLGIRIVQPIYNYGNWFGSGCFDEQDFGLTKAGHSALASLKRCGICIDHSHLSEGASFDIFKEQYPFNIATHTFSSTLAHHRRGKSDLFFKRLKEIEGFAALTVNPNFLCGDQLNVKDNFIRQVSHLINVMGENKIGIGTDWDGPMPDFLVGGLNSEANRLQNKNYLLGKKSNLYNGMLEWGNIVKILEGEFGKSLTRQLIGENAFKFLINFL